MKTEKEFCSGCGRYFDGPLVEPPGWGKQCKSCAERMILFGKDAEQRLRDNFAMAALTGLVRSNVGEWGKTKFGEIAYILADEMLEARKR